MRVKSIQGVVLAGAAVALLAACGNGQETRTTAPAPPVAVDAAAPVEPAAQPAPVEPATETQPERQTKPPEPPKPKPVIGTVSTTPELSCEGGWCTLPPGAGTVTFRAEATGAHRVEAFLVPTGTGTWDHRESLGVDRNGRDGWAVRWEYGDESVMGHLVVVARGPGGETRAEPFNLYRE